MDLHLVL